jgi:hypothetical protein
MERKFFNCCVVGRYRNIRNFEILLRTRITISWQGNGEAIMADNILHECSSSNFTTVRKHIGTGSQSCSKSVFLERKKKIPTYCYYSLMVWHYVCPDAMVAVIIHLCRFLPFSITANSRP